MSDVERRRAASEKLGKAIMEHIGDRYPVPGMLGDWIFVACTVEVDSEGDPMAQYHMGFSNGSMLDHVALGLLGKAEELLLGGDMREDDGSSES